MMKSTRTLMYMLSALALAHTSGAAQGTYQGTITAVQANIRDAPSLQAPIVTSLPQGTRLAVLGKESSWYRVQLPDPQADRSAFVHESTIRVEEITTPAAAPVGTTVPTVGLPGRIAAPGLVGIRDPHRARLMSYVIPGGGHLYSGEYGRGATHLVAAFGGYLLGDALSDHYAAQQRDLENLELGAVADCVGDVISTFFCSYPSVPRYLGIAVLGVSWLAGIADAPESAKRMNEKKGLDIRISTTTTTINPLLTIDGDGRPEVGFTITRND